MRSPCRFFCSWTVAALLLGAGEASAEVAARWPGGEVSLDQVRGCVKARKDRNVAPAEEEVMARRCAEDIALKEMVVQLATEEGYREGEAFIAARAKFLQRSLSREVEKAVGKGVPRPAEEEVEAEFARGDRLDFSWSRWETKAEAEKARAKIGEGEDLTAAAPPERSGKFSGRREDAAVPEEVRLQLGSIGRGRVSPPIETPEGVWLVKMDRYVRVSRHGRETRLQALHQERVQAAVAELLAALRVDIPVELDEEAVRSLTHGEESGWSSGREFMKLGEINGHPIYLDRFDVTGAFIHANLGVEQDKRFVAEKMRRIIDGLVNSALLAEEGRRRGFDEFPEAVALRLEIEKNALFRQYLDGKMKGSFSANEDDLKAYYAEHEERFLVPGRIHFKGARFAGEKEARDLVRRSGPGKDIEVEAKRAVTEGDSLGLTDLGKMEHDDLPAEYRDILLRLPLMKGRVVEASNGEFLVLWVLERTAAGKRSFDDARPRIESLLVAEKGDAFVDSLLDDLLEKSGLIVHSEVIEKP